jgi:hypothetical protein
MINAPITKTTATPRSVSSQFAGLVVGRAIVLDCGIMDGNRHCVGPSTERSSTRPDHLLDEMLSDEMLSDEMLSDEMLSQISGSDKGTALISRNSSMTVSNFYESVEIV